MKKIVILETTKPNLKKEEMFNFEIEEELWAKVNFVKDKDNNKTNRTKARNKVRRFQGELPEIV